MIIEDTYTTIDASKCFGVKIENDAYSSIFKKDAIIIVSPEKTPQSGDKVLIQFASDKYCTLAIYLSPTRLQMITATHTAALEYQANDFNILGTVIQEVMITMHVGNL